MDQLWDTVYQVTNSVGSPITRGTDIHHTTKKYSRSGDKNMNTTANFDDSLDSVSCRSSSTTNIQSLSITNKSSGSPLRSNDKKQKLSQSESFVQKSPLEHNVLASTNLLSKHSNDKGVWSTSSFLDGIFGNTERKINPLKRSGQFYKNRRSWSSASLSAYKRMSAFTKGNSLNTSNTDISNQKKTDVSRDQSSEDESDGIKEGIAEEKPITYTQQFADKFMERLLDMAIPTTAGVDDEKELSGLLSRIEMQKSRPALTVQTISKNSIALLQRLSLPFVLIDQIILIFRWKDPIYTLCILLAITLLILNPSTLLAIPFFALCYITMFPAFGKRHPVDQKTGEYSKGPMLSNIKYPKPVPEISREFLLNVTDLQNHMMIYVIPWDWINRIIVKYCYFKDERFTTALFVLSLVVGTAFSTFGSSLLVFMYPALKVLLVMSLWIFAFVMIPSNRIRLLEYIYSEDTRLRVVTLMNNLDVRLDNELTWLQNKEIRELEIFELQRFDKETNTWQPVCFSPEIYPINSHLRLENLPIEGCSDLSNIKAPKGWSFINEIAGQYNSRGTRNFSSSFLSNSNAKIRKVNSNLSLSSGRIHEKDDFTDDADLPFSAIKGVNGWYLDLVAINWARENYVDEVMTIDDDTKWCYDDIKDAKSIGSMYRRRRWIRYCTRSVRKDDEHEDSVIVED